MFSIHHAPQGTPYEAHNMTHQYRSGPLIFEHQRGTNQDLVPRLWHHLLGLVGSFFRTRSGHGRRPERAPRSKISRLLPYLSITLWVFTLWWGERVVFRRSIEKCAWHRWESWVSLSLNAILVSLCKPNTSLTAMSSLRKLRPTVLPYSLILSWWIPIRTLGAHGRYLCSQCTTRICIYGNPFANCNTR